MEGFIIFFFFRDSILPPKRHIGVRTRETHQNTVISGCVCARIPAISSAGSAWKCVLALLKANSAL